MEPHKGRLDALQLEVLRLLADIEPRWTLTGGGALAGFHLGHRRTRDLDLFFHGQPGLGSLVDDCIDRLKGAGVTRW